MGCLGTDIRIGTSPKTLGDTGTDLQTYIRFRLFKGLLVRIRHNEFNTLKLAGNHGVDSITATAPDTYDFDLCDAFRLCHSERHIYPLSST